MINRTYDNDFKLECVKYCEEHLDKRRFHVSFYNHGFSLTMTLLHQTNMKLRFRTRVLLCDIKRQLKSQVRLGYLLLEE